MSALLMARLLERGVVDLDRSIGEVMPELPEHLQPVTLRQLASHTGGVRHYQKLRFGWPPHETWSRVAYASVADSTATFTGDPLLFSPGAGFQYSTHGYSLLGAVLERAAATGFADLLAREVAAPLSLTDTGLDRPALEPGWARPYETLGGRYRNALVVDNSRCWPGGGIRSSAADLARLASVLPDGGFIRRETLETLLVPQQLADGSANPQNYALGWRLAQTNTFLGGAEKYRVAHHGGVSSGGSAFLVLFPDQSVSVAVLTNTRTGSRALIDLTFDVAEPFMASLLGI